VHKLLTFINSGRTRLSGGAVLVLALAMGCTEKNMVENNGEPNLTPSFAVGVSSSDFQQCANGKTGLSDCNWINSVLNATKTLYHEGEVIAERFAIHGLSSGAGNPHTLVFQYGFAKGNAPGTQANYDYIGKYDATLGSQANVCLATTAPVSAFCTGTALKAAFAGANHTTTAIPTTVFTQNVPSAFSTILADALANGPPAAFDAFGGEVQSVQNVTYQSGEAVIATIALTFTVNAGSGGNILLAWGGHFGAASDWGTGHGAAGQSGSPFHFKMVSLDGVTLGALGNNVSGSVVALAPALTIDKTADAATVDAGDQIGFTVTVNNTGTGPASNVVITDNLPTGTGITWSDDKAECSIDASSVLTCNISSIAASGSFAVHLTSPTTSASCAVYNNQATVSATNIDPHQSVQATVTVQCPALSVVKTPDAGTVAAGDSIKFTVTVSNTGAGTADNVVLTDTLPVPSGSGITWDVVPNTTTGGATCSVTAGLASEQILGCTIASLAGSNPGPAASFSVIVGDLTTPDACGSYPNLAHAVADNAPEASNAGSVTVTCPSLSLTKVADASPVAAGNTIGFVVTLSNASGAATAINATISDVLPGGSGINWSIAGTPTGSPDACSISGDAPATETLTCTKNSLAAGSSISVHLTTPTSTLSCAVYSNTATASATNADPPDDVTATITVNGCTEGRIAPTATTCSDFTGGTAGDLLTIEANLQGNLINNVSPGVFFYYSSVLFPSAGTYTVAVVESNTEGRPNFGVQQDQANLFSSNCTSANNLAVVTTSSGAAGLTVSYEITVPAGGLYIIGIKYETSAVVGGSGTGLPTTYTLVTKLEGTTITDNTDTIDLIKKPNGH
jgi:uncharacterized repeat protein (TIGR01451 family)